MPSVILSEAQDLMAFASDEIVSVAHGDEILRCAQDDMSLQQ
jgi:hypothetical protein